MICTVRISATRLLYRDRFPVTKNKTIYDQYSSGTDTEKAIALGKNVAFESRHVALFIPYAQLHLVNVPVQVTDLPAFAPLFDVGADTYLPPSKSGAFEPAVGRPRSEQRACGLVFFMHPQNPHSRAPLSRYLALFRLVSNCWRMHVNKSCI